MATDPLFESFWLSHPCALRLPFAGKVKPEPGTGNLNRFHVEPVEPTGKPELDQFGSNLGKHQFHHEPAGNRNWVELEPALNRNRPEPEPA